MPGDNGEMGMKELRLEYPSGWLHLTRHASLPLMVDALLDTPPSEKFTKTELAEQAGISRKSVRNHIHVLVELGVVEEIPDGRWPTYRLRTRNPITQKIYELNNTVSDVQAGILPKELDTDTSDRERSPDLYNQPGLSDQGDSLQYPSLALNTPLVT